MGNIENVVTELLILIQTVYVLIICKTCNVMGQMARRLSDEMPLLTAGVPEGLLDQAVKGVV